MLTPKMREDARHLFIMNGYKGIVDDAKIMSSLGILLEECRRHNTDLTSNLHVPTQAAFGQ